MAADWERLDHSHTWHPYTQMATAPPPIAIARASGAHLYTPDGRQILDAISSWWVTLHGHGEPRLVAAIARQAAELDHVIFAGFTHEPAARLAARLAALAPDGLERVFFSDDGSTAVEAALKMAYQHWLNVGEKPRRLFIAIDGGYHGDTFGAMSASGVALFQRTFEPLLFDVRRARNPYLSTTPSPDHHEARSAETLAHIDDLLTREGADVAAVIIEPMVQGAAGMIVWPSSFLVELRALCTRHRTLLIADEVFTGFGRTGPLLACQHGPITPDILCLSKAITGGTLPLAATLASDEVYRSFLSEDRRRTFFHGHSYTANPIACAASLASLDLLEESGLQRIAAIAAIHRRRIAELSARDVVTEARSIGLIARFSVASASAGSDATGYLDAIGPRLQQAFLARDILLRPLGNVVYILPPLAMTDDELERVYDAVGEVLDEVVIPSDPSSA